MSVAVDKQQQRLAELDETDEALEKQYLKISQKEYIQHIEKYGLSYVPCRVGSSD